MGVDGDMIGDVLMEGVGCMVEQDGEHGCMAGTHDTLDTVADDGVEGDDMNAWDDNTVCVDNAVSGDEEGDHGVVEEE